MDNKNDGQRKVMKRHGILLLLGSLILTGIMVAVMLRMYQSRNAQIFNSLVEENLTSIHKGQVVQIDDSIREVQILVKSVAQIYEKSDMAEHELNRLYQNAVEKLDILSDMEYFPSDILEESLSMDETGKTDAEVLKRLLDGESVISEVFASKYLDGEYAISVMEPVRKDGRMEGVVCGFIKAEVLMEVTARQDYEWTSNFLIKNDGSLILDEAMYYDGKENLFHELEEMGVSKNKTEEVRAGLSAGKTTLVSIESPLEGQFFIMTTDLQYNGWVLLSMTHSNEVKGYSTSIMKNTRLLITSLLLAQFSDTILFEYDCETKALAFTPNIIDHFDVRPEDIRYPFSQEQEFSLLHPDDVGIMREMLKSMQEDSRDQTEAEMRFLNKEGEYRWMHCQAQLLKDRRGRAVMVVGTERRQKNRSGSAWIM